jgi:hypothetical protein
MAKGLTQHELHMMTHVNEGRLESGNLDLRLSTFLCVLFCCGATGEDVKELYEELRLILREAYGEAFLKNKRGNGRIIDK